MPQYVRALVVARRQQAVASAAVTEAGLEAAEAAVAARAHGREAGALLVSRLRAKLAASMAWNDCNALLASWLTFWLNCVIYPVS